MVWFALVQISVLSPEAKKTLENANAAFLNVAYQAESIDHLKAQIEYTFRENGFTVHEIDEIKCLDDNKILLNPEQEILLSDIVNEGFDYSWGIYHTYDE